MGSGQNSRYGRNDNNGRGDRNQQYRGRGKRDPMIGKVVQITGAGIWKGSFATVLGVGGSSGEQYFLELHSKLKKVYINKKRCQEVSERSTSNITTEVILIQIWVIMVLEIETILPSMLCEPCTYYADSECSSYSDA